MDENGIGQIQPLSGLAILRVMMTPVQSEILPLPEFVVIRATTVLAKEQRPWGIQLVADLGPGFAPANSQNLGQQITGALGKRHSHSCQAELPQSQIKNPKSKIRCYTL
jgi:hypothetical protein